MALLHRLCHHHAARRPGGERPGAGAVLGAGTERRSSARRWWKCALRRGCQHFPSLSCPNIPVLGPIFFDQNVIVYMGLVLAPLAWFYIYRTRPGMELRAIGEYPAAADVLGINVIRQRYLYVILGGMLAGLGGAALSLAITPLWIEGMTAGQGWIALGLVIFAGWDPLRAAFGSYLFGAIRRLPLDAQNLPFFLANPQLGYFMNMLPYLFVILLMIISARGNMRRRIGAPAALGQPYVREERGVIDVLPQSHIAYTWLALSVAQDLFGVAPEADYRLVALAAVGPDLVDKPLAIRLLLPQV